jgi:hypothetical protein
MAITATTQPYDYMAAYSAIPLRLADNDYDNFEQFKYITNIIYDKVTINAISAIVLGTNNYTSCITATNHNFSVGDSIYLNDNSNSNFYTGFYIVIEVISSTQIIIDMPYSIPLVNNAIASNVIKYSMPPDIDGEAKLNLANTIKDFTTENLIDTNEAFAGPDTRFKFAINCGTEYIYQFEFDKYIDLSGNLAFINTGLTSTSSVKLEIGDSINISQDLYAWPYTDNFFSSGNVGFIGSTDSYYVSNASYFGPFTVDVTGQITNTNYNGVAQTISFPLNSIVINKPWGVSTPVEPGIIYGTPFPQVNSTATITNIQYSAGTGVIITTDLIADDIVLLNEILIYGKIKESSGQKTYNPNELTSKDLYAYNARFNNFDYSITAMDKYVVQSRANNLNYISTILDIESSQKRYRIERNTKSWLLIHTLSGVTNAAFYQFYNSSGSILGNLRIDNNSGNAEDFYVPVGIDQIIAATGKTETIGNITGYSDNIAYYHVNASFNNLTRSNRVYFELNDDCSSYELYHIMWKDSLGSWISMPFKYISRDNIEVERKNYYKSEGKWDNNTFGYDSYGRGEKNYYTRSRKSVILNSGWLEQFEVDLIEDLFESGDVYIQGPDNTLIAGKINSNKIELYKRDNNDMIQYQFEFIYSANNYRF